MKYVQVRKDRYQELVWNYRDKTSIQVVYDPQDDCYVMFHMTGEIA